MAQSAGLPSSSTSSTCCCCCCRCFFFFWLLIFLCFLGHGGGAGGKRWRGGEGEREQGEVKRRPEFGETDKSVTVQVGQNALLPCVVLHLNDRKVTWLRSRDLHILTTGRHTYSADERFQVVAGGEGRSWPLVVRSAQPRDSGVYECQVNTDPKLSRPVTLSVLHDKHQSTPWHPTNATQPLTVRKNKVFVANRTAVTTDGQLRVEIQGPAVVNIEEGSSLSLNCVVTSTMGAAAVVYWYHDTNLVDYHDPRGGIKLQINQESGVTEARLVKEGVSLDDSGMYSCVPAGSHPASIKVHVHTGKQEAAIQQSGLNDTTAASSGSASPTSPSSTSLLFLLLRQPYLLPSYFLLLLLHLLLLLLSLSDILPSPLLFVYLDRPFPRPIAFPLYYILCHAVSHSSPLVAAAFFRLCHSFQFAIGGFFRSLSVFYTFVRPLLRSLSRVAVHWLPHSSSFAGVSVFLLRSLPTVTINLFFSLPFIIISIFRSLSSFLVIVVRFLLSITVSLIRSLPVFSVLSLRSLLPLLRATPAKLSILLLRSSSALAMSRRRLATFTSSMSTRSQPSNGTTTKTDA